MGVGEKLVYDDAVVPVRTRIPAEPADTALAFNICSAGLRKFT